MVDLNAKCPGCGKLVFAGVSRGSVSHIICDDDTGEHWHSDCWKGEVPEIVKAMYAAEGKTERKS